MVQKFKNYLHLLRPKHYLKNFLIFLPLVFSGSFFNKNYLVTAVSSFVIFSMVASAVYIINDIHDIEHDRKHPQKKNRPISSGAVSVLEAVVISVLLLVAAFGFQYFVNASWICFALLATYVAINILYSRGLKNVPIIDVSILTLGFLIRVLYGGESLGIEVSKWLYLAVLTFSFYLGLGKRRNEIKLNGVHTRKVNKLYTQEFLDKNMYMCLALTIISYSLWAVDSNQVHKAVFWTVPLVIIIAMTYSLEIEKKESDGDPINVLTQNKILMGLVFGYAVLMILLIYL